MNIAEALGYTHQPDAILELPDKRAVPLIHRVDKHGEPYLLVVEGRFTDESEASLEVPLATAQLTKAAERQDLKLPRESLGKLIAEAFALEAPPRWVVVIAGNDKGTVGEVKQVIRATNRIIERLGFDMGKAGS